MRGGVDGMQEGQCRVRAPAVDLKVAVKDPADITASKVTRDTTPRRQPASQPAPTHPGQPGLTAVVIAQP